MIDAGRRSARNAIAAARPMPLVFFQTLTTCRCVNDSVSSSSTSDPADRVPAGLLAAAINRDFGGLESLGALFAAMIDELTCAGWVWLAAGKDDGGTLHVLSTAPHVFPKLQVYDALLERHVAPPGRLWIDPRARAAARAAWWSSVDWGQVGRHYERAVGCVQRTVGVGDSRGVTSHDHPGSI
jgi:superoxide dismutase